MAQSKKASGTTRASTRAHTAQSGEQTEERLARARELAEARERLYSRRHPPKTRGRSALSGGEVPPPPPQPPAEPAAAPEPEPDPTPNEPMTRTKKTPRSSVRLKLLFGGVLFFIVALILASAFLFFGRNNVSGENIAIAVDGPFALGGGETLSLDVRVGNQNSVAVRSATLIAEYPPGTQSAEEEGKELFRETVLLGDIASGESVNVPLSVRLFGEENEEKNVYISVQYRLDGSSSTFYTEADPYRVKISSSPVIITVNALKEISSGQEFPIELTIASNSASPIENLLIDAEYPAGFDYSGADPEPARGTNLWDLGTLAPEEERTITIDGAIIGGSAEERTFTFKAGVPSEGNPLALASILSTASLEAALTDPFIGLDVTINNSDASTVSVEPGSQVNTVIVFENTLEDTVYDVTLHAELSGNALADEFVQVQGGFYNSSVNTIVWDAQDISALRELAPGERATVSFRIDGVGAARTPEVNIAVSASGRRVSENNVPQELTDIVRRTVQYESIVTLTSFGLYSDGPFPNTGPVPPVAEQTTEYAIVLRADNSSNEVSDARVTASLPSYVTWTGDTSGDGSVSYDAGSGEVSWDVGGIPAGGTKEASFQLSFLPSVSQVGSVPTLVGTQYLRATDRFTGSVIRADAAALTTKLPKDPDATARDGRVQPKN